MIPGEYFLREEEIICNAGKEAVEVVVTNLGDRPVQVGSHFPFSKVNSYLSFERGLALNRHLDIPSGTGLRFEPGESKKVRLVAYGQTKNLIPRH